MWPLALESQFKVALYCNAHTECPVLLTTDDAASERELFLLLCSVTNKYSFRSDVQYSQLFKEEVVTPILLLLLRRG